MKQKDETNNRRKKGKGKLGQNTRQMGRLVLHVE